MNIEKMTKPLGNLEIVGDVICLRLFQESDISDTYVSWLNDAEVVKYSNQRFLHHTIESSHNYLKSFIGTSNIYMAVEDKATKELYGSITAYKQVHHGVVDIGLMIGNKQSWGKGVGFEAWTLMMNFLFAQCDVRKVTGGTLEVNTGMIRIMEKSMMIHEATRKHHELLDDKPVDIFYFCKFSDEK
jgi:[ribosomal protein S5]-alanine N-acetyltransferase